MKRTFIFFVPILFSSGFLLGQSLSPQVTSSSGNNSTSLCWTVGQISINTLSSNTTVLTQGFQQSDYKITSSLESVNSDVGISFYPNPTNSLLNICSKDHCNKIIELYTINGQLIYSVEFKGEAQIDLGRFTPSFYLLKIGSETFKIIKQ